jgi:hypothetical protein
MPMPNVNTSPCGGALCALTWRGSGETRLTPTSERHAPTWGRETVMKQIRAQESGVAHCICTAAPRRSFCQRVCLTGHRGC